MKVKAKVEETPLWSDYNDKEIDGLTVTCDRCDHKVEVFGTSDRSIRRGLVMLREECPNKEENYYIAEDAQ